MMILIKSPTIPFDVRNLFKNCQHRKNYTTHPNRGVVKFYDIVKKREESENKYSYSRKRVKSQIFHTNCGKLYEVMYLIVLDSLGQ